MTKKERNKIYRKMLFKFEKFHLPYGCFKTSMGFCFCLVTSQAYSSIFNFPELIKHMPSNKTTKELWFSTREEWGHTIRVLILLQAIKETS